MKTVVFFDVDGTLLRGNINTIVIYYLFRNHLISPVLLLRAMFWYFVWRVGVVDTIDTIAKKGARELRGISQSELEGIIEQAFQKSIERKVYQEGKDLIASHRAQGHEIILLSSSFEPFIRRVAKYFGLEHIIATRLALVGSTYTGGIAGEVVGGNKHKIVADYIAHNAPHEIYAYTDHWHDAAMLKLVTHPIAVNPDYLLRREARQKGWRILQFSRT